MGRRHRRGGRVGLAFVEELHARGLRVVMVDVDPAVVEGADRSKMLVPPVEPRAVIARGLDALALGGRWLADDGLEFAAAVERRERVDMISQATVPMFPQLLER